jgi:hypothetical protein
VGLSALGIAGLIGWRWMYDFSRNLDIERRSSKCRARCAAADPGLEANPQLHGDVVTDLGAWLAAAAFVAGVVAWSSRGAALESTAGSHGALTPSARSRRRARSG